MSSSRVLATAAAALVAAGVGAPLARADSGSEPVVDPQAVVDAALAAVATVPVPSVPAEPEEPMDASAAPAPAPVVLPVAEPASSGPTPEAPPPPESATEVTPEAQNEPDPAPAAAPVPPSVEADPNTGAEAADITQPAPISPPAAAPSSVAAVQQSPVNVNVSIRIESPGDGGSITQLNAVLVTKDGDGATGVEAPDPHPAKPGDIGRDTDAPPSESQADSVHDRACESNDGCCAIFVLDGMCLSADVTRILIPDIEGIIDTIFAYTIHNSRSTVTSPATAVQVGPVNLNISIRFKSPGNDGALVQTNLVQVRTAISVLVPTVVLPVANVDTTAQPAAAGASEAGSLALGSEQLADPAVVLEEPTIVWIPTATASLAFAPRLPNVRIALTIAPISLGGILISQSFGLPGAGIEAASTSTAGTQVAERSAPKPAKEDRHRHRPSPPAPESPVQPPLEASFAPAPPGAGGGGGGVPVALTIPFALGLLALGLQRLRTWRATPASTGGRRPERPG